MGALTFKGVQSFGIVRFLLSQGPDTQAITPLEVATQIPIPRPGSIRSVKMKPRVNTLDQPATINLKVNGITALSVVIPAGSTAIATIPGPIAVGFGALISVEIDTVLSLIGSVNLSVDMIFI